MVDGDGICGCTHYIYIHIYVIYAMICNMQKKRTCICIYIYIIYMYTSQRSMRFRAISVVAAITVLMDCTVLGVFL